MVDSSDSITAGPGTHSPAGMRARSQTAALTSPVSRNHTRRLPLTGSVPAGAVLSRVSRGGVAPPAGRRAPARLTGPPLLLWPGVGGGGAWKGGAVSLHAAGPRARGGAGLG